MAVVSSGWGPSGRRFKSCLPDYAGARFGSGLLAFGACFSHAQSPAVVPVLVPSPLISPDGLVPDGLRNRRSQVRILSGALRTPWNWAVLLFQSTCDGSTTHQAIRHTHGAFS